MITDCLHGFYHIGKLSMYLIKTLHVDAVQRSEEHRSGFIVTKATD